MAAYAENKEHIVTKLARFHLNLRAFTLSLTETEEPGACLLTLNL